MSKMMETLVLALGIFCAVNSLHLAKRDISQVMYKWMGQEPRILLDSYQAPGTRPPPKGRAAAAGDSTGASSGASSSDSSSDSSSSSSGASSSDSSSSSSGASSSDSSSSSSSSS